MLPWTLKGIKAVGTAARITRRGWFLLAFGAALSLAGVLFAGCSSDHVTTTTTSAALAPITAAPAAETTSTQAATTTSSAVTTTSTEPQVTGVGLFPVRIGNKWGYISRGGEVVITPQFNNAQPFREGLAGVEKDHVHGYIDTTGQMVLEIRYESAVPYPFSEGVAAATDDSYKAGYIDRSGEWVIEPRFDAAYGFSEGFAAVSVDGRYGFIDHSGSFVIQPQFLFALDFSEGLAAVAKVGSDTGQDRSEPKWGYIDRTGQFVIPPQYPYLNLDRIRCFPENFSEGLADVLVEGFQRRFIDKTGQFVLNTYQGASSFRDGLAAVAIDDKWGYIDIDGAFVIAPQFQNAHAFEDGLASVTDQNGKDAYIDKTGQIVWPEN